MLWLFSFFYLEEGVFLLSAGRPAPAFFRAADAEVILIDLAYWK